MIKRLAWLLLGAALLPGLACGSRTTDTGPTLAEADAPDADLEGPELFKDATAASGVDFIYRNGEDVSPHLSILSPRAAACLIDFDGDGLLDLFRRRLLRWAGQETDHRAALQAIQEPGRLDVQGRHQGSRPGLPGRRAAVVLHPRRRRR